VVLGLAGLLGFLAVGGLVAWLTLKGDSAATGKSDGLAASLLGPKANEDQGVKDSTRKADDAAGPGLPVKDTPDVRTEPRQAEPKPAEPKLDVAPMPRPPEPKEPPPKQPKDGKLAVPDKEKLADAQKEVERRFEVSKAKNKLELAEQLWRESEIASEPADRYALLEAARQLAAQGGNCPMAFQIIDNMDMRHRIDKWQLQIVTLETAAQANDPAVLQEVCGFSQKYAEDLVAQDRYEPAVQLLTVADAAARKSGNAALQDAVASRLKQVANLQKDYDAIKPVKDQLSKNPDDPEANLAWGKYLLLVKKQKVTQAAPYLAKGSDPQLKKLAQQEVDEPLEPKEMLALADGWRAQAEAEKGDARKQYLLRASHWYSSAIPRLAGLPRTKAEKDLKELDELLEKEFPGQSGSFASRSGPLRQELLMQGGGNARSEAAVADGLKWLSEHQGADGSWNSAKHQADGKCNCQPGHDDPMFGTAFALLAFLGAGETPRNGAYAKNVQKGVKWLLSKQQADGVLSGNGYIEGMATIALCEAYGMTKDPQLKGPAQKAINALVNWQGPDGGFRYAPKQAGDMSVSSWHIQALKAGQLAGLNVPKATLTAVGNFLDKVSTPDGSGCGYTGPQPTPRMTAAGMLCRQYTGWGPRNPGLVKAVDSHRRLPPSPAFKDMYHFYYSTQVMYNMGGEGWQRWNAGVEGRPGMRDLLIMAQDQGQSNGRAHQKGSWDPAGDAFGAQFGRLGYTCLCILTLEVYYRHAPLFSRKDQ